MARADRTKHMRRLAAAAIAALALGGCSAADAVLSMLRSTDQFVIDAAEPRIRYEPGAKALARQVGRHLDEAVKTVAERQYRPFVKPVVVYVCATTESCRAYCRRNVRGCTVNGRIFLSPKPTLTAERVPGILTHELSHLHMEQHIGMLRWHATAPPWFKEGLAVFVSGGGGAENVTASQARAAVAAGRTFSPEPAGSVLFRNRHGLEQHLFYRQSALFVAFLHAEDPKAFEALLAHLVARTGLATAVRESYHTGLEELWSQFVAEAKTGKVPGGARKSLLSRMALTLITSRHGKYAMYFHCQTTLVATFKETYRGLLRSGGNRSIVFDVNDEVPVEALRQ